MPARACAAMPSFLVTHLDARQRVQRSHVTAADAAAAGGALGLRPEWLLGVELAEAPAAASAWRVGRSAAFPLRSFSHELAVLLDAGIPLLEAVVTLREKEAAPRVAAALAALADALREGLPLSAGLRRRPEAFGPLFVAAVESSERTGQLAVALRRHADFLQWAQGLRAKLVGAAVYPALLLLAGLAVMVFLLTFVVPRFAGLLDVYRGELPLASRALMAVGAFGGEHPWAVVAAALALVALPVLALQSPACRAALRRAASGLPVIGGQLRLLELATLYRTASLLLGAGVPLVQALHTCEPLLAPDARAALQRAGLAVSQGARLSDSLDAESLTTPVSLRMVRVGERTGELGPMLERAAAFYDEQLLRLADLAGRVINPVLMLVMGVVVGAVVVLMYLPIFQLAEQVQ